MDRRRRSHKFQDLQGLRIGNLSVIQRSIPDGGSRANTSWECLCDCGTQIVRTSTALKTINKSGVPKSCGCLGRGVSSKFVDRVDQRFGRLTVLERMSDTASGLRWKCLCECGTQCQVSGTNLTRGIIRSCGCLRRESTTWNQASRLGEEAERSLYIAQHPSIKDLYKIGIAVNPAYRVKKAFGKMRVLDQIALTNSEVCMLEKTILDTTAHLSERPEDMLDKSGISEWRKGFEAVRTWHAVITEHLNGRRSEAMRPVV